jgi:uncharacterized protein (DUF1778 family)
MYERGDVHPGLATMRAGAGRDRQLELLVDLIDWIVAAATASGQSASDFMVNKFVEIDLDCVCEASDLP